MTLMNISIQNTRLAILIQLFYFQDQLFQETTQNLGYSQNDSSPRLPHPHPNFVYIHRHRPHQCWRCKPFTGRRLLFYARGELCIRLAQSIPYLQFSVLIQMKTDRIAVGLHNIPTSTIKQRLFLSSVSQPLVRRIQLHG